MLVKLENHQLNSFHAAFTMYLIITNSAYNHQTKLSTLIRDVPPEKP
jgi:hypothetical protein